ncbi:MAG: hypothetical protein IT422_15835 [Pirellulaceae bacterium]|nr:hypothetical protein [Pirellulaceae bacterium]
MPYKTIALELLESQPLLCEKLKANNSLLSTMELTAAQLRLNHQQLVEQTKPAHPDLSIEEIRSQALEFLTTHLQGYLAKLEQAHNLAVATPQQIQNALLSMMTR